MYVFLFLLQQWLLNISGDILSVPEVHMAIPTLSDTTYDIASLRNVTLTHLGSSVGGTKSVGTDETRLDGSRLGAFGVTSWSKRSTLLGPEL